MTEHEGTGVEAEAKVHTHTRQRCGKVNTEPGVGSDTWKRGEERGSAWETDVEAWKKR